MSKKQKLPGNTDLAAAFALADIAAPDGSYPPERVASDYEAKMAEAGITADNDQGFLLRSLTRRYVILETIFLQIARETGDPMPAQSKGTLMRSLSRLNDDMNKTLGIIHRIRLAQAEGFAPFLTNEDQAIVDDARAEQPMSGDHTLTLPQLVHAETEADLIVDTEFWTVDQRLT